MSLLRVLSHEIVNFHERLTSDKPSRRGNGKTTDTGVLPITADCLIVACTESVEFVREAFPNHSIILCEGSMSLLDYLDRRESRPVEVLVASAHVHRALLLNIGHLRKLTTFCLRRLWLRRPHSWLVERQLRVALHRDGFYEVAHCLSDEASWRYEQSSVGLYPNGEFQIIDRLPGVARAESVDWLLASRIPLLETDHLPWKWVYGVGMLGADEYLSAASDTAPILSVTDPGLGHGESSGIRITARIRWQCPVEGSAVGSLVGCYNGPGDANMYLAMVEPHTQNEMTISLWRNLGSWHQISRVSHSLPQAEYPQLVDCSGVEVTLEITKERLCLLCNGKEVLTAGDDSLPRNLCYGARMLGSKLQVGQIEAVPL